MADCVKTKKNEGKIEVIFDYSWEDISNKITDITEDEEGQALPDNWETIIRHFLSITGQDDLLAGAEIEPWGKGDCFFTYFDDTPENEAKADKYAEAVRAMLAKEEELLSFVRENLVDEK